MSAPSTSYATQTSLGGGGCNGENNMKHVFAIGLVATLLLAGSAAALDPITVPGSAAGASDYYLVVDEVAGTASVWEETNGLAGLQTEETEVDGRIVPADTQVA